MRDFLRIIHEAELPPLTREELLESAPVVTEAEIPPTQYGYWISDVGQIIPVPYMHSMTLHELGHDGDTVGALRNGWIRIIVGGGWSGEERLDIQCTVGCVTAKAIAGLARLCRSSDYVRFNVDADWDFGAWHPSASNRRDDLRDAAGSKTFHDTSAVVQYLQTVRA